MDSVMEGRSLWHSLEEGALLVFSSLDLVRPAVGLGKGEERLVVQRMLRASLSMS
jgi:hypothetical protein